VAQRRIRQHVSKSQSPTELEQPKVAETASNEY